MDGLSLMLRNETTTASRRRFIDRLRILPRWPLKHHFVAGAAIRARIVNDSTRIFTSLTAAVPTSITLTLATLIHGHATFATLGYPEQALVVHPSIPQTTEPPVNRTIIDRPKVEVTLTDGTNLRGTLVAFDGSTWTLITTASTDATTPNSTIDAGRVAVVVVTPRRDATSSYGFVPQSLGILRTINNQRLPGKLVFQSGQTKWEHRWIGVCPMELDQIASMSLTGDRTITRSPLSDILTLVNGDSLRGFVESMGEEITLSPIEDSGKIENSGTDVLESQKLQPTSAANSVQQGAETPRTNTDPPTTRKIALEKIASIAFAEVPTRIRTGIDIWTNDGSIVAAEELRFEETKGWSFVLADPRLRAVRGANTSDNLSADPLGIVLDRGRFLPLSKFLLQPVTTPEGAFRHSTRNTVHIGNGDARLLDCGSIEIVGPAVARFGVPRDERLSGRVTLSSTISLVRPTPADTRVRVVFRIGSTSSEIIELTSQAPQERIAITGVIEGTSMIEIEVTDGGNGIAGDRVLLDRAFVWSESTRGLDADESTKNRP